MTECIYYRCMCCRRSCPDFDGDGLADPGHSHADDCPFKNRDFYTYRYDGEKPSTTNVASSMEMDIFRPYLARSATRMASRTRTHETVAGKRKPPVAE